jgi:hypothetical protein
MKRGKEEHLIDWDALRAPTPPGRIPTPPWRHRKLPTTSNDKDQQRENKDRIDQHTRAIGLPTPPMQPYDMPKWGARQINWEQSTPDPGLDRKMNDKRLPGETVERDDPTEFQCKMKIQYLMNSE